MKPTNIVRVEGPKRNKGNYKSLEELTGAVLATEQDIEKLNTIAGDREPSDGLPSNMGRVTIAKNIKPIVTWALYHNEADNYDYLLYLDGDKVYYPYNPNTNEALVSAVSEFEAHEMNDVRDLEEKFGYNPLPFREGMEVRLPDGGEMSIPELNEMLDRGDIPMYEEAYDNILEQSLFTLENTIYIIQYDFTLNNSNVEIPNNCVLKFEGGSLSNGTLNCDDTILVHDQEIEDVLKNVELTGTYTESAGGGGVDKKDNVNGMATITLDKGKGFSEQLTQNNTIYRIVYDFDLNDAAGENPVQIPANCVLDFQGGSIKNGVIEGDDFVITDNGNTGFLENISFTGNFTNSIIKVKWFVKAFPTGVDDTTVNNAPEIQAALDCGGKLIEFPADKYLHVTSTLQVNKPLDILKEKTNDVVVPIRQENSVNVPCIFSYNKITILQYNCKKMNVYIGNIVLSCLRPFSTNEDVNQHKEDPILYVVNTGQDVWGMDIHADICTLNCPVIREMVIENESSTDNVNVGYYRNNYTGLRIRANNNYIAIANIYSYITGCYQGIVTEKFGSGNWFNDVTVHGMTVCAIGGRFCNSHGVKILSNHQTTYNFFEEEAKATGYFIGANIVMYGMVWDLGLKQTGYVSDGTSIDLNTRTSFYVSYTANYAVDDNVAELLYKNTTKVDCDISVANAPVKHSVAYNTAVFGADAIKDGHNLLDLLLTSGDVNTLRSTVFPYGASYTLTQGGSSVDLLDNPSNGWVTLYGFNNLFSSVYPSSSYGRSAILDNGAKAVLTSNNQATLEFTTTFVIPSNFPKSRLFYKSSVARGTTMSYYYDSNLYVPYSGEAGYHHTEISGTTYYYVPIELKAGMHLIIRDTEHCVILNQTHTALAGVSEITADSDMTVYIASISSGSYKRAYTISGFPNIDLGTGSWYEDIITVAPYVFEPDLYHHITITTTRANLYAVLPMIYLHTDADIKTQLANDTDHRPRFFAESGAAKNNIGLRYFNIDTMRSEEWNGNEWKDTGANSIIRYFQNASNYTINRSSNPLPIVSISTGKVYVMLKSHVSDTDYEQIYEITVNKFFEGLTVQDYSEFDVERIDGGTDTDPYFVGFSYSNGKVLLEYDLSVEPAYTLAAGNLKIATDTGVVLVSDQY